MGVENGVMGGAIIWLLFLGIYILKEYPITTYSHGPQVLNSQPICGPLIKQRVGPASVRFQDYSTASYKAVSYNMIMCWMLYLCMHGLMLFSLHSLTHYSMYICTQLGERIVNNITCYVLLSSLQLVSMVTGGIVFHN